MGYCTSRELSEKWGIGQCRIIKLAREGRIEGAVRYGKTWVFPENSIKPADSRKAFLPPEASGTDGFRFPFFEYQDVSGLQPPLCEAELAIRNAVQAFHACRFEDADRFLGDLPETAENRYHRLGALYCGCMIDFAMNNSPRFLDRYGHFSTELRKEFPHKTEMDLLFHGLEAFLGYYEYFLNSFHILPAERYHKSFLPFLATFTTYSAFLSKKQHPSDSDFYTCELNCLFLETTGSASNLQSVHNYLGFMYSLSGRQAEARGHFHRVFELAETYELYFCPASEYCYAPDLYEPVLSEFPESFQKKFKNISEELYNRFHATGESTSIQSIYCLLPPGDYIYVYYALQGYTYKEISLFLGKTQSSVGMRFNKIFSALGVGGKRDLIRLYRKSASTPPLTLGKENT